MSYPVRHYHEIRRALLDKQELALIDVREEASYAEGHPLFAVNIPLSRLELDIYARIPRSETPITLCDDGEGLAERAVRKLRDFGYRNVAMLAGGVSGWREAGGELFRDVNVPSKAFGELVAHQRGTPSLSATEVKRLIDEGENIAILDARRFDEYQTMSIPGGVSVPGAELTLRVDDLVPDPETRVIVNCAGRTRSIIGTQSLVNAGIRNPVSALRNGTIGWTLEGFDLEVGQQRRYQDREAGESSHQRVRASIRALDVAERAGVRRLSRDDLPAFLDDARTGYLLDVRSPEEYWAGHVPGSRSAPGGQLVQETDHIVGVRGARIALIDDDGTRANMTASWLAQMGWEVYVVDGLKPADFREVGEEKIPWPVVVEAGTITPKALSEWLEDGAVQILDLTSWANYQRGHIPDASWILRKDVADHVATLPSSHTVVLTCGSSLLARYAWADLPQVGERRFVVLAGGTRAWNDAGLPLESGEGTRLSPAIDRYRRPYEGVDNAREAMQGYLDWEFGLVEQLEKDGAHGFFVI